VRLEFFLPLLFLSQEPPAVPTLEVGVPVEGVVVAGDPVVRTPVLDANYTRAATVGKTWRLVVETSGPYHVDLRSFEFDAYLVLRDAEGALLAEDDDGLLGAHARLVAELEAGREYRVTACALHGMRGAFELRLAAGRPPARTAAERRAAERAEGLARIHWLEGRYGEESLEVADGLNRLGHSSDRAGDFSAAKGFLERALAIREKALGPEVPAVAESLNNLALLYQNQGRFAEAEPLFERTLSIREKAFVPEHPAVAESLNNLAGLYLAQGRYGESEPLNVRALSIREKAFGPEHPAVAESLNNLALLYKRQGRNVEAEPLFERAQAIVEKALGPEHSEVATSLNNLAGLYQAQGRYAEAEPLYERAFAIWKEALGPEHPAVATGLKNLGWLYYAQGRYAEAESLYERALAIRERALGSEHLAVGTCLSNLAILYQNQGRFAEAEPLQERARAIVEKALGPEHPDLAAELFNSAVLYASAGRYAEAEPLFKRAQVIVEKALGPEHPNVASSLSSLAAFYRTQGRYEEAVPLSERALTTLEKALGPEHSAVARSLNNLAVLFRCQARYAEAEPLLARALAIWEKALGPEHSDVATSLNNLAGLYQAQGRYAEAEPLYERTLAIREKAYGPEHSDVATSLNNLAGLYQAQGRYAEAEPLYKRALRGVLEHLDRELPTMSEADRFRLLTLDGDPGRLLSTTAELEGNDDVDVLDLFLRWKGKATQLQAASLALGRSRGDPEVRRRIGKLQGLQKELATLVFLPASAQAERHEERIAELRDRRLQVERELNRGLGLDSVLAIPTSQELQAALAADSVLVDFYVDSQVFAWVLHPEGEPELIPLGEAAPLRAAQEKFLREAVAAAGAPNADTGSGAALRELLWQPLRAAVGAAATVFVSPDGFLCELPLGVLPEAGGRYLLEKHRFVYFSDATKLLADGPAGADRQGAILAVGDVDYSQRGTAPEHRPLATATRSKVGEAWSSLRGTREELQFLRKLHDDTLRWSSEFTQLEGSAATEESVQLQIAGRRYVHIATHGYFEPDHLPSLLRDAERKESEARFDEAAQAVGLLPGLLSGLVFAGVNAEPDPFRDDGYLSAEEIQYLDLSACELAVLSACETALGSARSGEGLMSLRRAFEVAGARTVVSSLWRVDDQASERLMRGFYENYWAKGMGKAEALHRAKLDMIRDRRPPREWGAFVLSGDWR